LAETGNRFFSPTAMRGVTSGETVNAALFDGHFSCAHQQDAKASLIRPGEVPINPGRYGGRPSVIDASAARLQSPGSRETSMFREKNTRVLVEKIDDAIEQAENLGLTFVAGILMMARLEAVQTEQPAAAGRENRQLS
jgi:hypothetical protein